MLEGDELRLVPFCFCTLPVRTLQVGTMRQISTKIHLWMSGVFDRRAGQRGASLVEYAFLVALIAVVCIVAIIYFGGETSDSFSETGSRVRN